MTRYRKSWTEVIEEVILNEALKPLDKSVIDAFYYKKEKAGKVVSTDGDSLWKNGLGGQEIAIWMGRKIHISAVSDVKSTEAILKYMKKSIPAGLFEAVDANVLIAKIAEKLVAKAKKLGMSIEKKKDIKATKMPVPVPVVLVDESELTESTTTDKKNTFGMAPFKDLKNVADAALKIMTRQPQEVKEEEKEEVTKEDQPQQLTEQIV